jgi:hypothetical protein
MFSQNTTFRKINLFPISVKIKVAPTLLGPLETDSLYHWTLTTAISYGVNRAGTDIILLEDGKRSSFRNAVFFLENTERWTKSKNMILPSAIHHRQNPLELTEGQDDLTAVIDKQRSYNKTQNIMIQSH